VTFLGAPLSAVAGGFAVGGAALVALYVLKLRRRRVEVPFAYLWQRIVRDTESTALWKKLRRLVSLFIQLLILALLLFAVGDPRLATGSRGRTIVVVVDCSASMQAGDVKPTRMEAAKEAARNLVRGLGGDDVAMLVRMDAQPAPVSGFQSDDRELLREVEKLRAADAPADLERAMRLGADALRGRKNPELVLIGDGAWDPAVWGRVSATRHDLSTIDVSNIDLRYLPVGKSDKNLAITAFAVRRYRANQTAYEVLVEVQSFGPTAQTARLELSQDGEVVEVEPLTLQAGERVQRRYPNLAGDGTRLEARLAGTHDALPLDDVAYALLPPRHKLKVLVVTDGELFLMGAMGALLVDSNLDITKVTKYDAAETAKYDAVILDNVTPPADAPPRTHALYINPRGEGSPFHIAGEIAAPLVTESAASHPLMRWVTFKDLNIARASRFALEAGDVAVASALRQPVIAARDRDGHKVAAIGFALAKSDLPLRVAFPVLVVNALDWFGGNDGDLMTSFSTARPWRLRATGDELRIVDPDGVVHKAPVHEGRATFFGARVGYYQAGDRMFAANLASPAESRIEPRATLTVDGQTLKAPEPGQVGLRRALWAWLAALALLILCVEWWTYNRRVTV
jgi:von Willebrand factor type A domain/Aerotolerance regulator N-terminal